MVTSEGSIAGQIPKGLPELLMTEHGLLALQKATQLSDKAIELLDNKAKLREAKLRSNNVLSITLGEILHPPLVHGKQSMKIQTRRFSRV